MKHLIFSVLGFIFFSNAIAQQQNVCSQQFSPVNVAAINNGALLSEAKDIVTDIMNVTGLKAGFDTRAANVPNAAAIILNGKRYVLYNPAFIQQLNQATGNDWASVSVLAHEIGHHLNGHTINRTGSEPDKELEADEFSGYIMQRLGATLEEAQMAMKLAAAIKGTATHPGRTARIAAIEQGWNRASDQLNADIENATDTLEQPNVIIPSTQVANNHIVSVTNPPKVTLLEERDIAADIFFAEDPGGQYYLTHQRNMVGIKNDRLFLLGKLTATGHQNYPFIIEGKSNRLYIDKASNIIDKSGSKIGSVRDH